MNILQQHLTNVANAIRSKKGTTELIPAANFATEIENLPSVGDTKYFSEYIKASNVNDRSGILSSILSVPNFKLQGTSAQYMFANCSALTTIEGLDTSNGTNFTSMFQNCSALTTIEGLDTSNGTNFTSMFSRCSALTTIPQLDTNNGTNFASMFQSCSALTTIPQLDTNNGTNFASMFNDCSALTTIPQLDTNNGTNFASMFANCLKLTTIEGLDTSNSTSFTSMFSRCFALTTIPQLDTSNGTNFSGMFTYCSALTTFGGLKNVGKAYTQKSNNYSNYKLDLSSSSNLTYESLMNIINNLYDLNLTYNVANGGTLYTQRLDLGAANKAKLTAEEIAVATAKRMDN